MRLSPDNQDLDSYSLTCMDRLASKCELSRLPDGCRCFVAQLIWAESCNARMAVERKSDGLGMLRHSISGSILGNEQGIYHSPAISCLLDR